jgi:hypothetical protein
VSDATEETVVETPGVTAPKQVSAADDPRAKDSIRRAKGYGGLAGFAITAFAAYLHGEMITSILLRGLIGGIAGNRVAWLAAVVVWRRIIRAELHHGYEQLMLSRARAAAAQSEN